MIPLSLITGFLGSGKTTLLKAIASRHQEKKLVFLVNEFSSEDVDGKTLSALHPDTLVIPGGSIFCRCLVTDFIRNLTELPERFGTVDAPLDGVVVEASGIADPRITRTLLAETGMDSIYSLTSIITIVDPGTFIKLRDTLPNIEAQVQAADTVLINKTDRFDAGTIMETETAVRAIRPDAAIVRTAYCADIPPLFEDGAFQDQAGEMAPCRDPNFDKLVLYPANDSDSEKLLDVLKRTADIVYRAKGFLPYSGGIRYMDYTPENMTFVSLSDHDVESRDMPADDPEHTPGVVVIFSGHAGANADILRALAQDLPAVPPTG